MLDTRWRLKVNFQGLEVHEDFPKLDCSWKGNKELFDAAVDLKNVIEALEFQTAKKKPREPKTQ